jgi:hypothetical protein
VKGYNAAEIDNYARLVELGQPDFIEIKGVTFCGSSKGQEGRDHPHTTLTPPTHYPHTTHTRGLYNGKYPPLPRGGKYQPMSFGGKNMKRPREKGGKCGRKGKKRGRKGKEKGKKRERKGKEKGKKKEERGKKIRKEEAKGKTKCKIGKN